MARYATYLCEEHLKPIFVVDSDDDDTQIYNAYVVCNKAESEARLVLNKTLEIECFKDGVERNFFFLAL